MEPMLSVEGLTVRLGGSTILKNLTFSIAQGDNLAVIGPNGSGKTVLLKTLLGMFPHEGTFSWSPTARIGYVPQKIDADRHLPVSLRDLLLAKAHIYRRGSRDIAAAVKTIGLPPETITKPLGELSGGQFQKALIVLALLGDPNVIIFDEPTASLDQRSEEHAYELMHRLQDERGITVLLVSHDLGVISRYATKVLCINKEQLCFGEPALAMDPAVLDRLYGAPHPHHPLHQHGN